MAVDCKGTQYPKSVILYAVYFYVRYAVSYRDLEEILEERGIKVDHSTLNRWVAKYAPLISAKAQKNKRHTANSCRMDETYIKVKGEWTYLYRAVDRDGQTLDFMLSKRRDTTASRRFFKQAINFIRKFTGNGQPIRAIQSKYLNNMIEQDHRFIKRITRPMLGFRAFHSAAATLVGIEIEHMSRKGQIIAAGAIDFQKFVALAG